MSRLVSFLRTPSGREWLIVFLGTYAGVAAYVWGGQ
jgi:hypothetical protein